MTRDQFISWLKGFTAAIEETPTKGQWETIVSELNKIQECIDWNSPISDPNIFPKWQEPHYFPNIDKSGKVRYGDICGCNPKNGGNGICGCVIANELVEQNTKQNSASTGTIVTDGFVQNLSTLGKTSNNFTFTTTPNRGSITYITKDDSKNR